MTIAATWACPRVEMIEPHRLQEPNCGQCQCARCGHVCVYDIDQASNPVLQHAVKVCFVCLFGQGVDPAVSNPPRES